MVADDLEVQRALTDLNLAIKVLQHSPADLRTKRRAVKRVMWAAWRVQRRLKRIRRRRDERAPEPAV
ncbi:hypothetical protein GCM10009733_041760 [Nonomuraea maheshkhaliensis]|uniref:CHAD domain-containing protein n=1 Tax=Nonomuraea maheshkhaliensis TaxID=419590 RepID=A0ABN2FC76_9ACTN